MGGAAIVGVLVALVAWWSSASSWGTATERTASPSGEYEIVQYEWDGIIDGGWTLAIERVDGTEREWFWRSFELPRPTEVRFTGPTAIEVTDDLEQVYRITFDPATLEPSDRYCPNPTYCTDAPWDAFTAEGP